MKKIVFVSRLEANVVHHPARGMAIMQNRLSVVCAFSLIGIFRGSVCGVLERG